MVRHSAKCVAAFAVVVLTLASRNAAAEEEEPSRFRGLALVPFVRVDTLAPDLSVGLDFDPVSWSVVGVTTGVSPGGISGSVSGRLRIPAFEGERSSVALTLETAYSTFGRYDYAVQGCKDTTSGWADGGNDCYGFSTRVHVHERPAFWSGLVGAEFLFVSGLQLRVFAGGGKLMSDHGVHDETRNGSIAGGGKEGAAAEFGAALGYRFQL